MNERKTVLHFILDGTFCFILCEFVQLLKCVKLLSALTKLGTFTWSVAAYKVCGSTTHSLHFGLNRSGKVVCFWVCLFFFFLQVVSVCVCVYISI